MFIIKTIQYIWKLYLALFLLCISQKQQKKLLQRIPKLLLILHSLALIHFEFHLSNHNLTYLVYTEPICPTHPIIDITIPSSLYPCTSLYAWLLQYNLTFNNVFIDSNLWWITLNTFVSTKDISSMTTNQSCSHWSIRLFKFFECKLSMN
jgi:hypothetical protein